MRFVTFGLLLLYSSVVSAVEYSTANFVASADDSVVAAQAAQIAEMKRDELAVLWFGKQFPRWSAKCPIQIKIDDSSGSGATMFRFDNGEVFDWNMQVKGTRHAVLNDVIPHEVNHTVFATHYRRPLPRWADEGAASTVESETGKSSRRMYLEQIYGSRFFIPFGPLLDIKEYPNSNAAIGALYSEGASITEFLIEQKGHKQFAGFLNQHHANGWDSALKQSYGFNGVPDLYREWCEWVQVTQLNQTVVSNRGPNGEKASVVVFVTTTCTNCGPIKQAIRDGKFNDYNLYLVWLDGPNSQPYCDLNFNNRVDENEVKYGQQFVKQFQTECKRECNIVPLVFIPLTAQYIIGATEIAELLRWTATVVKRFFNIIFKQRPPIGNDPAQPPAKVNPIGGRPVPTHEPIAAVPVPPPTSESETEPVVETEPESEPAVETETIDWSDVNIVVLVDTTEHELAAKILPFVRGTVTRKIKEMADGKATVSIVDNKSNPTGYAAVIAAANVKPDPVYVMALVQRQNLGLKNLIAGRVEEKIQHQHLDGLRKLSVEVIFERTDKTEYRKITDALTVQPAPVSNFNSLFAGIGGALAGLAFGFGRDLFRRKAIGFVGNKLSGHVEKPQQKQTAVTPTESHDSLELSVNG